MPMPTTWAALRGDDRQKDWYRRGELIAAAVALGAPFGEWEVRKAIRNLPKPSVRHYGHLHYGREHLEAVLAAAKSWLDRQEATGLPYATTGE